MMPPIPPGLGQIDRMNWMVHFATRSEKEKKYFGSQYPPDIDLLEVNESMLNGDKTAKFLKELNPDMVLVFGSGMLREPLISVLPRDTINLHLGISPRYRGAATLFWPFYFLEPNWAGTTFHYIVNTPDGGDIIHQVRPVLERKDGMHDVACKAVVQSTIEAVALFKMDNWKRYKQKPEAGKNFLASDFKPQHLRVIYQDFGTDMVRAYLDGEIKVKEPNLKRQF